ncbi:helix-turn-helix transcriptional regulator [Novosphingobium sp. JCM 18896]|uniref:helix-turn-helix transcriptional regulator n=1 Tax=Novosphingobium sp. JCM 18896 TaxID=2989731 RepID=UPI0022235143|nr:AlpA family transcriptional regulator [Novosphingobium sp. JCM 18896]MCW1429356.1 AlpA family transcriptional regulator [Novosphingobium sp. JCM 18896]
MTEESPERILRLKEVLVRTGLSRATVYRKILDGTFPCQRKLSARCSGWLESEIMNWIKSTVLCSHR